MDLDCEWNNRPAMNQHQLQPQPPPRRKRAPVACRRCRRLRSKCVHEGAKPPCELCRAAGQESAASCEFVGRSRGLRERQMHINDREYRQRQNHVLGTYARHADDTTIILHDNESLNGRLNKSQPLNIWSRSPSLISPPLSTAVPAEDDLWSVLPPFDEVVQGCQTFSTDCFQLAFVHKILFMERLTTDRNSISVFFILSMLSVSARFTKCLIRRYGDAAKATEYFIARAGDLLSTQIFKPNLERTQAFFLLGVSEWIRGDTTRSSMHMGIAVRMAGIQHLHREETYSLPQSPTAEEIASSEIARRTFWCLESQDHLYSEYNAAVAFPLSDMTTLLPSSESDFTFGILPKGRGALRGSLAASKDPELVNLSSRSLFGTLVQAHNFWGQVARRAGRARRVEREKLDESLKPYDNGSDYAQLTKTLKDWEETIPHRHRWSAWNFRGYKTESYHLAYLCAVMVARLNNIVIRRIYLEDILDSILSHSSSDSTIITYWATMSNELFTNVYSLHEIVDTFFSHRAPDQGVPSIIVFCVYICGSLASYLCKWPQLCPDLAPRAEVILNRSLEVLADLLDHWPLVSRWLNALQNIAMPIQAKKNLDTQEQVTHISHARRPEQHHPPEPGMSSGIDPQLQAQSQPNDDVVLLMGLASGEQSEVMNQSNEIASTKVSSSIPVEKDLDRFGHDGYDTHPAEGGGIDHGRTMNSYARGGEMVGGMSSLDFYSAYTFDYELMQLLQVDG